MAFVPTENGARVVLVSHLNGGIVGTNHFWFRKLTYTSADMHTLVAVFRNLVLTNNGMKDYINQDIHWSFRAVDERSYDGEVYLYDQGDDGEDITELYSLNDAMVLTLYTGKRGRAYRGRLYFFGWAEDALTDGVYNAAAQTALLTSIGQMESAVNSEGWTWCVRQSQIDKVPQNPCTLTEITSTAIRTGIPATQMRRAQRP